MEFYSLLNSYGYVVYENKKKFWKKVFRKIFFRVMKKFRSNFFDIFRSKIFIIFSKNINILVAKTCDFPKKRCNFVDKSTPSISRIYFPKKGHLFCGHLELFFFTKNHKKWSKLMVFGYFVMTNFFNMLMSNLPLKILTSSKNHINFRQTFH